MLAHSLASDKADHRAGEVYISHHENEVNDTVHNIARHSSLNCDGPCRLILIDTRQLFNNSGILFSAMAKLTINSKLPLKSGYEMPTLGFGVSYAKASAQTLAY